MIAEDIVEREFRMDLRGVVAVLQAESGGCMPLPIAQGIDSVLDLRLTVRELQGLRSGGMEGVAILCPQVRGEDAACKLQRVSAG